ncbi:uncharacterized protein I206_106468 [Kwoniella pini CBS 10737]|uniref:Monocarboxylic acid transporter n=1 Tax=Kwoniella pini CBS 10737 TaxID=1296096 RepID=A0A1B9HUD6_9TREE|nr:monocarboxylic acid transporter [Kwoniella pini CBS 10737]OCF46886.1 monocarboxylic acid transporter [Kwoniella pini CBS 10737]
MSPSSALPSGDIELIAISGQNPILQSDFQSVGRSTEDENPFQSPSSSRVNSTYSINQNINLSQNDHSNETQQRISSPSPNRDRTEEGHNPTEILPPVDGGSKAWLFLVAATYIEIIIWGLPFSIGVLHVYWTNTLFNGQGESTITLAATLQTGLSYMTIACFGPIFTAYPRMTKTLQIGGLTVASLAMIASAFVTKPWHLIVTMGIFYPLASATYFPCATLLFEWFHAKRGFASGVMYSGTGLGGFIFPFLMQGLLSRFGYKAAMISLGIGYAITGNIALLAIQRRIPLSRYSQDNSSKRRRRPRIDWTFLRRSALYLAIFTIALTSMGNFIPSLWLPSFVNEVGLNKPNGTVLIAILNASSVPGNALLGYLSDKLPLKWTVCISCVGSALSCAFLWGFGTNSAVLVAFAITFGLLGLSFTTLWTQMVGTISKDDPVVTGLTYSIFAFMRGVGNLSSGPISDKLLKIGVLRGATGAYGFHNYGILLIYTAVTILSGGITGLMFK